jgi:hypothetical protein
MQQLTPAGGGAKAREMAVLRSHFKIEGLWEITEPEIARVFEGRDFAFFEVEPTGDQEFRIVRQVEDSGLVSNEVCGRALRDTR